MGLHRLARRAQRQLKLQRCVVPQQTVFDLETQIRLHQAQVQARPLRLRDRRLCLFFGHDVKVGHASSPRKIFLVPTQTGDGVEMSVRSEETRTGITP